METIKVKIRWVILNEGKIFLAKLKDLFACLPWWTLELWESFEQCLERELIEELWVKPVIWKQIYNQHFLGKNGIHIIDFWYEVLNPKDYVNVDITKTSHGHELEKVWFFDIDKIYDLDFEVKPKWIKEILSK